MRVTHRHSRGPSITRINDIIADHASLTSQDSSVCHCHPGLIMCHMCVKCPRTLTIPPTVLSGVNLGGGTGGGTSPPWVSYCPPKVYT